MDKLDGILYNIDYSKSSNFLPKEELLAILKCPINERKEKLKEYKEKLKKYFFDIALLIKEIKHFIKSDPNGHIGKFLKENELFLNLPMKTKDIFLYRLYFYIKIADKNKVIYNKYKDNPKALLKENYNIEGLKGEVSLENKYGCLVFTFFSKKDFKNIFSSKSIYGFFDNQNHTIFALKNSEYENTLLHEIQHFINYIVFGFVDARKFKSDFYNDIKNLQNILLLDIRPYINYVNELLYKDTIDDLEKKFVLKDEIIARLVENNLKYILNVLEKSYFSDFYDEKEQFDFLLDFFVIAEQVKKKYPNLSSELLSVMPKSLLKDILNKAIDFNTIKKYKKLKYYFMDNIQIFLNILILSEIIYILSLG